MRAEILNATGRGNEGAGLDAMISCSPENFAYAAGFVVPSQPLIRHRHAMVILTRRRRAGLFGVDMEASTIARHEPETPTRIWAEFSDDPMLVLADQLKEMGLASARIGIEMDYLPAGDMARLQTRRFPMRVSSLRSGSWHGSARSRQLTKFRFCGGCRGSPTRRSSRRSPPFAPATARWTSPGI